MNPTRLLNLDGTLRTIDRALTVDVFGDPESEETTSSVKCWLEQRTRSEYTTNANLGEERYNLYLPPDVDVKNSDAITVDDVTYEFDGPPWRAVHPKTREVTHLETTVRRVA